MRGNFVAPPFYCMNKISLFFSKPLPVVILVLLIDQISKIWIKTNMYLGQEFHVLGDWFIIHFTENNGMAFGLELGGEIGKIILSVFRILAVIVIGYFVFRLPKEGAPKGLIICGALVLAGAIGNIIDSVFYGLIFNESYGQVATLFPAEGGYAPILQGRVVDMLYFPLIEGFFPEWVPFWGGEYFLFFRPVFNIADSAISVGIFIIFIFHKRFFNKKKSSEETITENTDSINA
ncbi:signal peptidase II [Flavobacteriales bacterium]|nr:signal peptidase II [Flavobacteriales bacterium]